MSNLPITEFVNYIYSDDHEKKIVYIAIGSAHYRTEIINGIKQIDDKYNQQYPLYIRDLHLNNPDHKLYIVLIDPVLENPCYSVANKIINTNQEIKSNDINENWQVTNYSNIYENREDNVILMEFRNYVIYGENNYYNLESASICDINNQLHTLNQIAMVDKWFINLMDYTGKDLYLLAEYFDKFIDNKDKDHIFYGLASRIEGGCYIDLTEKSVYFVTNRNHGYITAFTPYIYEKDKLIDIYKYFNKNQNNNIESYIIIQQIKIAYNRIIHRFKSDILTIYRRFINYKNKYDKSNKDNINNPQFYSSDCEFIKIKYDLDIKNKEEFYQNIDVILLKISNILDTEFDSMCVIFNKCELKDRYMIAKQHNDPYIMYFEICKVVNDFILNI